MKFMILCLAMAALPILASANKPSAAEMARCLKWTIDRFGDAKHTPILAPPFSFVYAGKPFAEIAHQWSRTISVKRLTKKRTERTLIYTDPETGLQVVCAAVQYGDFPTVEWTLRFKNTGKSDTPIISGIQALDIGFEREKSHEFLLHWNNADNCTVDSYAPHADALGPNAEFRVASAGGRPTTGSFPYWNLEFDGGGAIVVLSWGGQWAASFLRDPGKGIRIKAGQELTHFSLKPGEEVTSPLAIVQFYEGSAVRAQNIWRRWMLAFNTPHIKGLMPGTLLGMTSCGYCEGLRSNIEFEKSFIDKYVAAKTGLDFWNHDAGWYPCGNAWWNVGTWEPDLARYPKGLKEESDYVHERGMKFMVWFEPERAAAGSWLAENKPDWIYGGKNGGLVKLGQPEVWRWIVEKIDGLIKSQGVDIYRQDFNIAPLDYWRGNDQPDRQGITEIRHVEAYYAYWDELLRRNPGMLIDSCASGGRRNNIETLRRAVFFLRSDCQGDAIGHQVHTYGLSSWMPIQGTGAFLGTEYDGRSGYTPIGGLALDANDPNADWALLKRLSKEWHEVVPNMLGDYYPLTPFSLEGDAWIGWQFDLPEKGKGSVHVFRRPEAEADSLVLKLQGLSPNATYRVKSYDGLPDIERKGKDLMEKGIHVEIKSKPGSALYAYRKMSR